MRASLSRFELLEKIGRGGMGEVWLARDRETGASAALKHLRADGLDAEGLARFEREAETLARLDHPGVVRLLAWGVEGIVPWLAMEHLPGGTVHEQVVRGGPLGQREAVAIGIELARALAHVHAAGVVHRDVKSENLLRDAAGRIKLADFGLCRPVASGGSLTTTGAILGTPAFAAPEQLLGQPSRVGPPTDVYGLGGVLYHLLTGSPPNRGETYVAAIESALGAAPAPGDLRADLDPDLEEIVVRCLAPQPADRYPDAEAAARALEAWASLRAAERLSARRGRRLVRLATIGLFSAVPLLGLSIAVVLASRRASARPEPARPPAAATTTSTVPEARAAALEELLDRARAAVAREEWEQAVQELDRAVALDPASIPARLGRAQCRLELGDEAGALEDAERAVALAPERADAWGVLGEVQRRRGDLSGCEAALRRGLALDPESTSLRLLQVRALAGTPGRLDDALAAAEEAARLLPGDPEVTLLRGGLLHMAGRSREALGAVEGYLARAPGDPRGLEVRARIHLALNAPAEALADAEAALAADPAAFRALHVRAQLLAREGEPRLALADLDRALARAPDDRTLLSLRAELRQGLGELDGARADLEHALRRGPDDRLSLLLAGVELEARRLERAEEHLARVGDAGTPDATVLRARLREARGDRRGAIDLLDRLVESGQAEPQAFARRGALLLADERNAEALRDLDRALESLPGRPQLLCDRGLARIALGDEGGLADIERARALRPLLGLWARGVAHVRLRRWDEARRDLEAVVADRPGSQEAVGARKLLQLIAEQGR